MIIGQWEMESGCVSYHVFRRRFFRSQPVLLSHKDIFHETPARSKIQTSMTVGITPEAADYIYIIFQKLAAEHSTMVTQPLQLLWALSRYRGSKLPQLCNHVCPIHRYCFFLFANIFCFHWRHWSMFGATTLEKILGQLRQSLIHDLAPNMVKLLFMYLL